jgi:hypothetical protein
MAVGICMFGGSISRIQGSLMIGSDANVTVALNKCVTGMQGNRIAAIVKDWLDAHPERWHDAMTTRRYSIYQHQVTARNHRAGAWLRGQILVARAPCPSARRTPKSRLKGPGRVSKATSLAEPGALAEGVSSEGIASKTA